MNSLNVCGEQPAAYIIVPRQWWSPHFFSRLAEQFPYILQLWQRPGCCDVLLWYDPDALDPVALGVTALGPRPLYGLDQPCSPARAHQLLQQAQEQLGNAGVGYAIVIHPANAPRGRQ